MFTGPYFIHVCKSYGVLASHWIVLNARDTRGWLSQGLCKVRAGEQRGVIGLWLSGRRAHASVSLA